MNAEEGPALARLLHRKLDAVDELARRGTTYSDAWLQKRLVIGRETVRGV